MTNMTDSAQLLNPMRDDSTPDGVHMWLMEAGTTLPADCPVSSAHFIVEPSAATETDVHDVVEVWTVLSGRGTVLAGSARKEICQGQSIFFPSRVDHQLVNESDAPVEVFSIWWMRATQ